MKYIKVPLLAALMALLLALPVSADLKKGDTGPDVFELQRLLWESGWIFEEPDGSFGDRTEQALKNYQEFAGFAPDGIADDTVMAQLRHDHAVLLGLPYDDVEDGGADVPMYCLVTAGEDRVMTEFCARHLETARQAQQLLADDPDNTAAAADLWETAVHELYSEKILNAAAGDKLEVMASYASFKAYAEKYRAALELQWTHDAAAVDQEMMNVYEEQAVLLCGMEAFGEAGEFDGAEEYDGYGTDQPDDSKVGPAGF